MGRAWPHRASSYQERPVKLVRLLPGFLIGLSLLTSLCFFGPLSRDGDFYYHLAFGNQWLDTGRLPRTDTFSYTATGVPNELHSWLGSVTLAWVDRVAGEAGVRGLHFLIAIVVLGCFLFGLSRRHQMVKGLLAALFFFFLHRELADLRPLLFGELFFTVGILLLIPFLDRSGWSLWRKWLAIFCWAVAWNQFHGTALMVLPICLLIFWGRERWALFSAALLGVCIGPAGPLGILGSFNLMWIAKTFEVIEWLPPIILSRAPGGVDITLAASTLAAALALVAFAVRSKRRHWGHAILCLLFLGLFLSSRRHLTFLIAPAAWAIAAVPLSRRLSFVFCAAAALLTLSLKPWEGMPVTAMPTRALDYIESQKISGNVFPLQSWGGYVSYRTAGRMKTALDCRISVHEKMARYYVDAVGKNGLVDLTRVLSHFPETDLVLFPASVPIEDLFRERGSVIWRNEVATLFKFGAKGRTAVEGRSEPLPPAWDERAYSEAVVRRAVYLRRRGMLLASEKVLRDAMGNGVMTREISLEWGQALIELGERERAREWTARLMEIYGDDEAVVLLHRRVDPLAMQ